jgi:diketogulonate reductase-like aldo/keto reductase
VGAASAECHRDSKASDNNHVRDNAHSIDIKLAKEDLAELDKEFPPPKTKKSLPML